MKRLLTILLALGLSSAVSACTSEGLIPEPDSPQRPEAPGGNEHTDDNDQSMKLTLQVGSVEFSATLADTPAAQAFRRMLPMTLGMHELNRNEKYGDLPGGLPASPGRPGTIRTGDIMLYGSGTLVLFYKTFESAYLYTRIGAIDDPAGLEQALGAGSTNVTFRVASETNNES